jgi:hypothetical protein
MGFRDNAPGPVGEWGPDTRTRDHWEDAARRARTDEHHAHAGPAFLRLYLTAFGVAALLGLIGGVVVVSARLWHVYVWPLW